MGSQGVWYERYSMVTNDWRRNRRSIHQTTSLWRAVSDAIARRIGPRPVWLSTAGAAVAWLHVRLDDRPKYYAYSPYRRE